MKTTVIDIGGLAECSQEIYKRRGRERHNGGLALYVPCKLEVNKNLIFHSLIKKKKSKFAK